MLEFYLCLFGGMLGLHKFYVKDYKRGILYAVTGGLFFVGWIYDIVKLYKETGLAEKRQDKRVAKAEAKAKAREQRKAALAAEKEKAEQMDREGIAYCPSCKSTSIQYVERRQRLSVGRAVVGTVLLNPVWGAVGAVTSNKRQGMVKCLRCGFSWRL